MTCETLDAYKHRMVQNDTGPSIRRRLLQCSDNNPKSLDGATAKFFMRTEDGTQVVDATAVIEAPPADAYLRYDWSAPDTVAAGTFYGRFQITFASGEIFSCPNDGWIEIEIMEEFGS